MQINPINSVNNQNFGAKPNRILYDYIASAIPSTNAKGAADTSLKLLKKLEAINSIFTQKSLVMPEGNSNFVIINLDDSFLTTIDKSEPVIKNLDKIYKAMRGRMKYLQYHNQPGFILHASADVAQRKNKYKVEV